MLIRFMKKLMKWIIIIIICLIIFTFLLFLGAFYPCNESLRHIDDLKKAWDNPQELNIVCKETFKLFNLLR